MSKYRKNPFIIGGLFLIFSIIFLFIFFNKTSRNLLVEQIQHRQQLSVRVTSKSMENFLNSLGKNLVTVSNDPSQKNLDQFISFWSESDVTGIIYVNKGGIVTRMSNLAKTNDTGINVSERDYYKWSKKAKKGDFFVFPPRLSQIGASKGKYTIPITAPVFSNRNIFEGLVSASILLSDVTESYLDNLKVLDSSKVYLVASGGEIIYSEQLEIAGKNFIDIFDTDFLGKEKMTEIIINELNKDGESKLELAFSNHENGLSLEPYLISAAPVKISDQLWKVVVVTPEKSLVAYTYQVFNGQVILAFIVVTLFIVLTLRMSRHSGYHEAVADEHKLHSIKNH